MARSGSGPGCNEIHRTPGGKELESVVEVTEYEPDRTFALRVSRGRRSISGSPSSRVAVAR